MGHYFLDRQYFGHWISTFLTFFLLPLFKAVDEISRKRKADRPATAAAAEEVSPGVKVSALSNTNGDTVSITPDTPTTGQMTHQHACLGVYTAPPPLH